MTDIAITQRATFIPHDGVAKRPLVSTIIKATAKHYGLGQRELLQRTQMPRVCHPRQVAMFLARRHTSHSTANLGRLFGDRTPSTVRNAHQKIEQRIKHDPSLADAVAALEGAI